MTKIKYGNHISNRINYNVQVRDNIIYDLNTPAVPWNPTSASADPLFWWQHGNYLTTANSKVFRWEDSSGFENELTQSTDANRPTSSSLNGVGMVNITGGFCHMQTTTPAPQWSSTNFASLFFLLRVQDNIGTYQNVSVFAPASSVSYIWLFVTSSPQSTFKLKSVFAQTAFIPSFGLPPKDFGPCWVTDALSFDIWYVVSAVWDASQAPGSEMKIRINGTLNGVAENSYDSSASLVSSTQIDLAYHDFDANIRGFSGSVVEAFAYSSSLTSTEISNNENYLTQIKNLITN